jgi:hypothetical protein
MQNSAKLHGLNNNSKNHHTNSKIAFPSKQASASGLARFPLNGAQ